MQLEEAIQVTEEQVSIKITKTGLHQAGHH